MKEGGSNGAPDLAAHYATAFSAYLADRGERELGAAYDLGREAVAARLSVLDLAEAHHAALRAALDDGARPPEATLQAAADFLRESLSIFESVHRGYSEVREVARVEHEHVEQLRALADASVALNSSLTVEEILQITADAARSLIGGTRATVAIFAPDPRLRPLTATSPPLLTDGEAEPARLTAEPDGPRARARHARGGRPARARVHRARRDDPHAARPARLGGDLQRPAVRARAHDRPDPPALAATGRPARRARPVRRRPLPARPARAWSWAGTSTTSTRRAAAPGPR